MNNCARWIYYPADFEIMLMNRVNMRRRERDIIMPPIWHMPEVYHCVKFAKKFTLQRRQKIKLYADGKFNVELDVPGHYLYGKYDELLLEAGEHSLTVTVYHETALPCLLVEGEEIVSDSSWACTAFDGEWVQAKESNFCFPSHSPNSFKLKNKYLPPASCENREKGKLYDLGRETFAKVVFRGVRGQNGVIHVYYGESELEALDTECSETLDRLPVRRGGIIRSEARGFRYVYVECENTSYDSVDFESEYAVLYDRTLFRSDNDLLTRIWETSLHTMRLTTHELFIDGIKRDRWVWMGDTAQSILMNWYCFYDTETVRRTLVAFGGKGNVTQYMNTINDYTLYWFSALADYYDHTGDEAFLKEIYPRALKHIEFCIGRLDSDGFMAGREGDWVFVDWFDGLTKEGALSFLQILLWKAYRTVAEISAIVGNEQNEKEFSARADLLKQKINDTYWDREKGAFVWSTCDKRVFRQPNLMAVVTGFADGKQRTDILALLRDHIIPQIETPYMRFYELSALAQLGEKEYVARAMLDYWGGMLLRGATSFWEKYDPDEDEKTCLSMYGRKYGKSLCHAWGAAPLYLIGRYLVGLDTGNDLGRSFELRPCFELLGNFELRFPLLKGELVIRRDSDGIFVRSTDLSGRLYLPDGTEYEIKPKLGFRLNYEKTI